MANNEVNGDDFTTLTMDSAVFTLFMAVEVNGDIKVRLASAAVTNKNVSSLPFRRESPRNQKLIEYLIVHSGPTTILLNKS